MILFVCVHQGKLFHNWTRLTVINIQSGAAWTKKKKFSFLFFSFLFKQTPGNDKSLATNQNTANCTTDTVDPDMLIM